MLVKIVRTYYMLDRNYVRVLYGSRVKGEKWAGEAPDIRSPADPEHATSFQLWNSQQQQLSFSLPAVTQSSERWRFLFFFHILSLDCVSIC